MDRETGMYYYGARYYDPRMSIFVSVDPLAEEFPNYGGYVYTMNNPINLIDPTGMAPEDWIFYFKGGLLSGFEDTGKGNKIHIVNDGQSLFHRSDIQRRSEMNQITNFIGKRINKDLSYSYEEVTGTKGGHESDGNVVVTNNAYQFGNYNDVVSVIEHEDLHNKYGDVKSFKDHVKVYFDQAKSDTFKKTSRGFKAAHAVSTAQRLLNSYIDGEIGVFEFNDRITEYNKLNTEFKLNKAGAVKQKDEKISISNTSRTVKYEKNLDPKK